MATRAHEPRFGRYLSLAVVALLCGSPAVLAQAAAGAAEDEVRQTFRDYEAALRRGDPGEIGRFWADEYTFVNPDGERLTKRQRLDNLTKRRTGFDAVQPQPAHERILVFGDAAMHQTVMQLAGDYSGHPHEGRYETLSVLVRRDGRWLQVASQLTRVAARPRQEDPGAMTTQTMWTGCLQAASAGATFRLNLDAGTAVSGPNDPASLGTPFVQLIGDTERLDLSRHVGRRVRVTGRALTYDESVREAARRPDQQEAAETAAGTGGRPQRHLRYVRVDTVEALSGTCR